MDPHAVHFDQFARLRPWRFNRVSDTDALNRLVTAEVIAALQNAMRAAKKLMIICPVGPLDYSYWAEAMNQAATDGSFLITVNMDEYLNQQGELVEKTHPLSFRAFMDKQLFSRLKGRSRVPPANIHFPSPRVPEETTELIRAHAGADICFGGMGLTGHFAFNDPPDEPSSDEDIADSRTRTVTICTVTQAQMCMGGTGGNWDIIPKRAITLGMHELLASKKIHLTFMRSWHAGVLRRALFGDVSRDCPGSFIQRHSNVEVSLTELAASLPLVNVAQRIAE